MKTKIQGIHLEVTDAMKGTIDKRISKLSKKLKNTPITDLKVELTVVKRDQICHIIAIGDKTYIASKKSNDMYNSINECFDILEQNILKVKGKYITNKKNHNLKTKIKNDVKIEDELLIQEIEE